MEENLTFLLLYTYDSLVIFIYYYTQLTAHSSQLTAHSSQLTAFDSDF